MSQDLLSFVRFRNTRWIFAGNRASWDCARAALAVRWMSPELVTETRRVWSQAFGRVISEDEAVEILANVRQLTAALLHAQEEPI